MKHSNTVGSSTAERILNCPASYKLSQQMPKAPESSYAKEGTALHAAMEAILLGHLPTAYPPHGTSICDAVEVIDHDFDGVTISRSLYTEMIKPAIEEFDRLFIDFEYLTETTVAFPGIDGAFGTGDVIAALDDPVDVGVTAIVDFKFGRGKHVPAKDNSQLLYIAAGARKDPRTADMFKPNRKIVGAIIQPAFSHTADEWWFTHADVDAFEEALKASWHRAVSDSPGDAVEGSWCQFCPAKVVCPAKAQKMAKLRALATQPQQTNEHLTPAEIGEMATLARELKEICAAAEQLCHQELERGVRVPGWKLVPKRAVRRYTDDDVVDKFMRGMKMKNEDRYTRKVISPKQLEDWIKANSSDRARKTRLSRLEGLTVSNSSGTTLAPEDDNRRAVENVTAKELIARITNV
jgi:hypothetical protein